MKVPCKVDLSHGNVCYGVEKSWPKKTFNKSDFKSLQPEEKQRINARMERKAVQLYTEYVDEDRLKRRKRRRLNRALAPYYEETFRRNQFLRIKALGDPTPQDDECILVSTEDESININSSCSGSDNEVSLQTVIYTDLPCSGDRQLNNEARYVEVCSESVVSSSIEIQSSGRSECATPLTFSEKRIDIQTPSLSELVRNKFSDSFELVVGDEDEDEVDSLDFISQGLIGVTSTQNQSQSQSQPQDVY